VPLSPTQRDPADEASGTTVLAWHPPHPEQGTGTHRYTLVLLKQAGPLDLSTETIPRHGPLLLRSWLARREASLVGIYHWICSNKGPRYGPTAATVSQIYKDILSAFVRALRPSARLILVRTETKEPVYVKNYKMDKFRLYGAIGRNKDDI
jgi:hypothetical protein